MDRTHFSNTIVYFNGPPSVGKDTLGAAFKNDFNCAVHMFKEHLITLGLTVYNITRAEFDQLYKDKETPTHKLGGRSPRQALIHLSEDVIKPAFGTPYFGQATARTISAEDVQSNGVVMTDCGFGPEINEVVKAFPNTRHILVRLYRKGCNFDLDSRNWVLDQDFEGQHTLDVDCINNPSLAAAQVVVAICKIPKGVAA